MSRLRVIQGGAARRRRLLPVAPLDLLALAVILAVSLASALWLSYWMGWL